MKLESSQFKKIKLEGGIAHQYILGNSIYEQLYPTSARGWLIGNSHHHPFAEYYIPTSSCDAILLYLGDNRLNVKKLPHRKATGIKDAPHQIIVKKSLLHLLIEATQEYLKKATVPLDYSLYERANKEGLL